MFAIINGRYSCEPVLFSNHDWFFAIRFLCDSLSRNVAMFWWQTHSCCLYRWPKDHNVWCKVGFKISLSPFLWLRKMFSSSIPQYLFPVCRLRFLFCLLSPFFSQDTHSQTLFHYNSIFSFFFHLPACQHLRNHDHLLFCFFICRYRLRLRTSRYDLPAVYRLDRGHAKTTFSTLLPNERADC